MNSEVLGGRCLIGEHHDCTRYTISGNATIISCECPCHFRTCALCGKSIANGKEIVLPDVPGHTHARCAVQHLVALDMQKREARQARKKSKETTS